MRTILITVGKMRLWRTARRIGESFVSNENTVDCMVVTEVTSVRMVMIYTSWTTLMTRNTEASTKCSKTKNIFTVQKSSQYENDDDSTKSFPEDSDVHFIYVWPPTKKFRKWQPNILGKSPKIGIVFVIFWKNNMSQPRWLNSQTRKSEYQVLRCYSKSKTLLSKKNHSVQHMCNKQHIHQQYCFKSKQGKSCTTLQGRVTTKHNGGNG